MRTPWPCAPPVLAIIACCGLAALPARAVDLAIQADLRRGLAAVGPGASDAPALRLEGQGRAPSPAFRLGAALGAWTNAAAILAYDLKTPSGDGGDAEAIELDCYDEKTALAHLEAGRQPLGLTPQQVLASAGVTDQGLLAAWRARQAGPPPACR